MGSIGICGLPLFPEHLAFLSPRAPLSCGEPITAPDVGQVNLPLPHSDARP